MTEDEEFMAKKRRMKEEADALLAAPDVDTPTLKDADAGEAGS